jgi:hypothetical protein
MCGSCLVHIGDALGLALKFRWDSVDGDCGVRVVVISAEHATWVWHGGAGGCRVGVVLTSGAHW